MTWNCLVEVPMVPGRRAATGASAEGSDVWSGGLPRPNGARTDGPFGTPSRARDEVRKWSMRGRRIRYNYLHNTHGFEGRGCRGVYLDDCFPSADISSNIFCDVANAIPIGGGRDNPITGNMLINCGRAFHVDARGLGSASGVGDFATKELHDLNYKQPPWSTRYPELLGILEDEPLAPKGSVMARNVCWGTPWGWTEPKAEPYLTFEDNLIDVDPLFTEQPPASSLYVAFDNAVDPRIPMGMGQRRRRRSRAEQLRSGRVRLVQGRNAE